MLAIWVLTINIINWENWEMASFLQFFSAKIKKLKRPLRLSRLIRHLWVKGNVSFWGKRFRLLSWYHIPILSRWGKRMRLIRICILLWNKLMVESCLSILDRMSLRKKRLLWLCISLLKRYSICILLELFTEILNLKIF
jgi:hypothetical protein